MVEAQGVFLLLQHPRGLLYISPGQGEADVLAGIPPDGLDDSVHIDVGPAQQGEHPEGHAGIVFQPHYRNPRDACILRHAGDVCLFHFDDLLHFRAGLLLQAGHDFHIHTVLFCQFHAAVVEHLGSLAGQLQHLVVSNLLQLHRAGNHPGVRGIHAVHISINLAQVRPEGGGQGHGAGVGPAPAQGSHVAEAINPLEAGHQDDLVLIQLLLNALRVNALNPGVGVGAGGMHAHLPGRQTHHRQAHALQGHGAQGDGDLLAGAQEHVRLPLGGLGIDLPRLFNQVVGGVALGGQNHHDLVAGSISIGDDAGHVPDALGIPDGAAAEFLYN